MTMKKVIAGITGAGIAIAIAGCGGQTPAGPSVTGMNLVNAESTLSQASINYQTHAQDGLFGIIDPNNWTVCSENSINGQTVMLNAAKYGC
jgi:hypothetical protein